KENTVFYDVPVLTGRCSVCSTTYHGDRERFKHARYDLWNNCYLNSAKYLKVGQSVWVDRIFGQGVINGTYNFHASASAYMQYWNDSALAKGIQFRFSRRHIWQAFVQESIRMVASVNGDELSLPENTNISTVTKLAFQKLGQKGVLPIGLNHSCSACKQPHKADADIVGNDDPAAIVDADENENVPALVGEDAEVSAANTAQARQETQQRREQLDHTMDVDNNLNRKEDVEMIILDGIVMGPTHCSYDGCTEDLKNSRGGAFCWDHERNYGPLCRVKNCNNVKIANTQACQNHQAEWKKYKAEHSRAALGGVRRRLQRPDEHVPWQNYAQRAPRRHDNNDDDDEPPPRTHFFGPSRYYCVETICAPCGVVIAWTKFDKSESPTNILQFISDVYPHEQTRPAYICIDKACRVLRTAITHEERWGHLLETSRFIVDSYHYINHRVSDYLCRKFCNPAPLDGSAPNLVKTVVDKFGNRALARAFNTIACEQLNAWLGGFESILKRMTPGNFDWFLHVILLYHTIQVIQKQERKQLLVQLDEEEEMDEEEKNETVQHWRN
ncbi:hypothetical protein CVT26_008260, partial [Gymnopilus dilepis]